MTNGVARSERFMALRNNRHRDGVRFLTVGTKPMMREAEAMLRQLGYEAPGRNMLLG